MISDRSIGNHMGSSRARLLRSLNTKINDPPTSQVQHAAAPTRAASCGKRIGVLRKRGRRLTSGANIPAYHEDSAGDG